MRLLRLFARTLPLAAALAHAAPAIEAPAPAASAARSAKPSADDSLDRLRQRLAERLGASAADDGRGTLRLSAHAAGAASAPPRRQKMITEMRDEHPSTHAHQEAHWSYAGAGGPDSWGRLKPEFARCASGTRQSPIDIRDGIKVALDPVQFDYKPSAFRVIDNGHTVQVNVAPGNAIEVMGRRYELVQFHFHRPSEERIAGRQFDMVAHLVHKDAEGRLAVVAVLLDKGGAQPVVQQVWNNLPLEKGEELAARLPIDLNQLLPEQRAYFTYMGSLTTPPCSEGVLWMVMKQPVQVSDYQVAVFSRLYPMNARPVQGAFDRVIKESE
jgi:carbonic anhydrase